MVGDEEEEEPPSEVADMLCVDSPAHYRFLESSAVRGHWGVSIQHTCSADNHVRTGPSDNGVFVSSRETVLAPVGG